MASIAPRTRNFFEGSDCSDLRDAFCVSSRLALLSANLEKIANGKELDEKAKRNMHEMGQMFERIDWHSKGYEKSTFDCVLATSIRPFFYHALIKLEIPDSEQKSLFDRFYKMLNSCGGKNELSEEEFKKSKDTVDFMSRDLLLYSEFGVKPYLPFY